MTLTAMDLVAQAKTNITELSPEQANNELENCLILDVREPAEFAAGCLNNAINIPRGVLEFKINSHPHFQNKQDAKIIVYCLTGGRSALATESLNKLGYTNATSLAGGYTAWQQNGYTVTQPE